MNPAVILRRRRVGGPSINFYVDSVNGDDGNDGTSIATAFQTLSAITPADNLKIGLVAGSYFEETVDWSAYDGISVQGVGDLSQDGLPEINGSSVYGGTWNDSTDRADAYTNTHSADFTTDAQGVPLVFEGLTALKWVDTVAEVDAEAGTFTCSGGGSTGLAAGTYTFYVHPTGSTDPDTDGLEYRYSHRAAPKAGPNFDWRYVKMSRFVSRNGFGSGVGGAGYQHGILYFQMSVVHASIMESGTYSYCHVVHDIDDSREGSIWLEFYTADGTGLTGVWDHCTGVGVDGSAQTHTFIGGHTGTSQPLYDSVTAIDCSAKYANIGLDVQAETVTIARPHLYKGKITVTNDVTITDAWMDVRDNSAPIAIEGSASDTLVIDGLRLYGDTQTAAITFGDLILTNSVFVRDNTVFRSRGPWRSVGTITAMTGCAFDGNGGSWAEQAEALSIASSDYNAFFSNVRMDINGVTYNTLAAVQGIGLDLNSAQSDPDCADPANGDFSLNGSGLPAGVGLERFPTYTTVPADLAAAEAWITA